MYFANVKIPKVVESGWVIEDGGIEIRDSIKCVKHYPSKVWIFSKRVHFTTTFIV